MMTEIMKSDVKLDRGGEGELTLSAISWEGGTSAKEFALVFKPKRKRRSLLLREFPGGALVRAVRSFRRFVLLSDEIKAGY